MSKTSGVNHVIVACAALSGGKVDSVAVTALAIDLDAAGQPVKRVRLLPLGDFTARDGRAFSVTSLAHAQAIVRISQDFAGAQDIPVDYDHQTSYGAVPGVGGTAPASGWIKPASLSAEADGIYAEVEWTPAAAAAIQAKEYRYLSPDIAYDKATGRVLRINHAGLTNMPAIDGLTRLAASLNPQEENMDLSALAVSLGLAATASYDEILAAQRAQHASLSALVTATGAADATAALSNINTLKAVPKAGDGQVVVAADMLTSMQAQLAALSNKNIEGEVDSAIAAGKVTPAQRQHYIDLMRTNPTVALSLIGSNPVVVPAGETLGGRPKGEAIAALSVDQRLVADLLGVSHDAFLKTLQESSQ